MVWAAGAGEGSVEVRCGVAGGVDSEGGRAAEEVVERDAAAVTFAALCELSKSTGRGKVVLSVHASCKQRLTGYEVKHAMIR